MCEMSHRCQAADTDATEALLRDAGQQAQYCIDATDEIPAGGVEWYSDSIAGFDISGPLDRMVPREASGSVVEARSNEQGSPNDQSI